MDDSRQRGCRRRTLALPIKIVKGCRIGANAVLLPGVTTGKGAAIGAGSAFTRDTPANVVAVDNPCRATIEINL